MNAKIPSFVTGVLCIIGILMADTKINYNATNLQLFPKVTYTSGGNYLFTWISNHSGQSFEIYSRAASYSGSDFSFILNQDESVSNTSLADGHRLNAETLPSIDPLTSDKGAIISWVDHYDQQVKAVRISSNGTRDFSPVIVHGVNSVDNYESVQICSDGDGGAYFTWVEKTQSGDNYLHKVKLQHVSSSGTKWPTDVELASFTTTDPKLIPFPVTPRVCSYGTGYVRVAIAWVGFESYTGDLYPDEGNETDEVWMVYLNVWDEGTGALLYTTPKKVANAGLRTKSYNSGDHRKWSSINIAMNSNQDIFVAMRYNATPAVTERGVKVGIIKREEMLVNVVSSTGSISELMLLDYIENPLSASTSPIVREIYSRLSTPQIAINTDNSAYVVWSKEDPFGSRDYYARSNIYISKITSSGGCAWNQDCVKQINYTDILISCNRAPQVVSYNNDALVVWESMNSEGKNSKLRYRKISSAGTPGDEDYVSSNPDDKNGYSFDLINDANSAIVVWSRKNSTDWDIYANKFTF